MIGIDRDRNVIIFVSTGRRFANAILIRKSFSDIALQPQNHAGRTAYRHWEFCRLCGKVRSDFQVFENPIEISVQI